VFIHFGSFGNFKVLLDNKVPSGIFGEVIHRTR
jgi:hypothetical protein